MPKKKTEPVTMTALTREMLSSLMPEEDNATDALTQMGIKRTGAALVVFGLIQKASKGDPSAAKFLKELNGEEEQPEETSSIGIENLSDAMLMKLAGITLKELSKNEE